MQISGVFSIILSKINRLFLVRDAKFKMNQKLKKIRRIHNFQHHFFQEKLTKKLILIAIRTILRKIIEKKFSRIFSKKRCFAHLYTKKNHTRAGTVG
jgi:hypothetical protein